MDMYLGMILLFAGNFVPKGFLACDGSLLSITQYSALYSLLGNYFGGNGSTNFALPDLRSRVPVGVGQGQGLANYTLGQATGVENVALNVSQIPAHNHTVQAVAAAGDTPDPTGHFLAITNDGNGINYQSYNSTLPSPVGLGGSTVTPTGGSGQHSNIQPVLALQYCICVQGLFPSRP